MTIKLFGSKLLECDLPRLNSKARTVWDFMLRLQDFNDGVDLNLLANNLGYPHSTVTAIVRAFRYDKNGAHEVKSWRLSDGSGTWVYRLIPNTPDGARAAKLRAKTKSPSKSVAYKTGFNDGLLHTHKLLRDFVTTRSGWGMSPSILRFKKKLEDELKGLENDD